MRRRLIRLILVLAILGRAWTDVPCAVGEAERIERMWFVRLPHTGSSQLLSVMHSAADASLFAPSRCARAGPASDADASSSSCGCASVRYKIVYEDHTNYRPRPLADATLTDVMTLRQPVAYQDTVLRSVRSQTAWLRRVRGDPNASFGAMSTDDAIEVRDGVPRRICLAS